MTISLLGNGVLSRQRFLELFAGFGLPWWTHETARLRAFQAPMKTMGVSSLGHNYPRVVKAVVRGWNFPLELNKKAVAFMGQRPAEIT
jgi:hypothetical protein